MAPLVINGSQDCFLMLHKVHVFVYAQVDKCFMAFHINRNFFDEYKPFAVTVCVFLRHQVVHVPSRSFLKKRLVWGKSGHKRDVVFEQLNGIFLRKVSGVKDCLVYGNPVLLKLILFVELVTKEIVVSVIDLDDVITGHLGPVHQDHRIFFFSACLVYAGLNVHGKAFLMLYNSAS